MRSAYLRSYLLAALGEVVIRDLEGDGLLSSVHSERSLGQVLGKWIELQKE